MEPIWAVSPGMMPGSFDPKNRLKNYQYALEGFFVRERDNWIDVLHTFSKNESNIMPVLKTENNDSWDILSYRIS